MGVAPSRRCGHPRRRSFAGGRLGLFVLVAVGYGLGSELAFSWFAADGLNATFFPAAGDARRAAPRRGAGGRSSSRLQASLS
jgi:hypothetical protein